jgi:hypothetical protein
MTKSIDFTVFRSRLYGGGGASCSGRERRGADGHLDEGVGAALGGGAGQVGGVGSRPRRRRASALSTLKNSSAIVSRASSSVWRRRGHDDVGFNPWDEEHGNGVSAGHGSPCESRTGGHPPVTFPVLARRSGGWSSRCGVVTGWGDGRRSSARCRPPTTLLWSRSGVVDRTSFLSN